MFASTPRSLRASVGGALLFVACAPDPAAPEEPAEEPAQAPPACVGQPVDEPAAALAPFDHVTIRSLQALPDGRLGAVLRSAFDGVRPAVAVLREKAPDPKLDGDGSIALDSAVDLVALRADGSFWYGTNDKRAPMLARRTPTGAPDVDFGTAGKLELDADALVALAVDGANRPLLLLEADGTTALTRLLQDGTPDPSFSGGALPIAGEVSLLTLPDGRAAVWSTDFDPELALVDASGADDHFFPIVAVGDGPRLAGVSWSAVHFLLAVTWDGARSELYAIGRDGAVSAPVALTTPAGLFEVASVQADGAGAVLAAGTLWDNATLAFVSGWVVRLLPDLTPDPCFGGGAGLAVEMGAPTATSGALPDGSVWFGNDDVSFGSALARFAPLTP